ncbi:MAG: response regulator [Polyangiaceae bacterium]|nr:response regulator [Polyangiaceae bacterium]
MAPPTARILVVDSPSSVGRRWLGALVRRGHDVRSVSDAVDARLTITDAWRFHVAVAHHDAPGCAEGIGWLRRHAERGPVVVLVGGTDEPRDHGTWCEVRSVPPPTDEDHLVELVEQCLAPAAVPGASEGRGRPPSGVRRHASNPTVRAVSEPTLRALVVEDDATLGNVYARLLAAAGCDVAVACDGVEALALLVVEHFDFVLSDRDMPRRGGRELLHAMRARHMTTPFVLMSGGEVARPAPGEGVTLQKPIPASTLFALVDELRARGAGVAPKAAGS